MTVVNSPAHAIHFFSQGTLTVSGVIVDDSEYRSFLLISAATHHSCRTGQGDEPNSKSNGKPAGQCDRFTWNC